MPNKPTLTQKQKKAAALATLFLFILLSLAVFWFVGRPMVRFAKEPELFRQWIDGLGLWGKAVYVGMCMLQVVVAIIPESPWRFAAAMPSAAYGAAFCVCWVCF